MGSVPHREQLLAQQPSKIRQGIYGYLEQTWLGGLKKKDKCNIFFFASICMATLNLSFVCITASQCTQTDHCYGHGLDTNTEQLPKLRLLSQCVAFIEAGVVIFHVCRICVDVVLIHYMKEPGIMMRQLIYNLDTVSSFSLLEYLPFPAKVMYWWTHRMRLLDEWVFDPPLLRGTSKEARKEVEERCGSGPCVKEASIRILQVSMFTIEALTPLSMFLFVLLSIPAFAVKAHAISDLHEGHFLHWDVKHWIVFFGVINQITKIWNIKHVELVSAMHQMAILSRPDEVNGHKLDDHCEWKLQVTLGCKFYTVFDDWRNMEFSLYSCLALLSQLDVGIFSKVHRAGFGRLNNELLDMAEVDWESFT